MSRRKIITPRAMPRQAEVISLTGYRALRIMQHTPAEAKGILVEGVERKEEKAFSEICTALLRQPVQEPQETQTGERARVFNFKDARGEYRPRLGDVVTILDERGEWEVVELESAPFDCVALVNTATRAPARGLYSPELLTPVKRKGGA